MPNIVSQILIWEEHGRLWARITTNAEKSSVTGRLRDKGVMHLVEALYPFFGDRVRGGSGYDILWKQGTAREQMVKALSAL